MTIEQRIERIEKAVGVPKYVGIHYVATRYGVSESYLRARPWLQPNYGVSDVPGKLLWHTDLVDDWTETSPAARERFWNVMTPEQKKAVTSARSRTTRS